MPKGTTNRKKRTKVLADEAELASVQEQYKYTSEYRNKAFGSSERSVNDLLDYFSATTEGAKKILGWILVIWGVLSFAGQGQYADGSAANTLPLFGSTAILGVGIYLIRTAKKNDAKKK